MARKPRKQSSTDIYHVTMRGNGRRAIFEDNADRNTYIGLLREAVQKYDVDLLAWCLMNNHVHILVRCQFNDLSKCFHLIGTSYAAHYNGRHGHIGSLFQDRFASQPIESESHLLAAIRYIHLNPLEAGCGTPEEWIWSSYSQYCGESGICDSNFVRSAFGSVVEFISFCAPESDSESLCRLENPQRRLGDGEANKVAVERYGEHYADAIAQMFPEDRNTALRDLKHAGLSIRQIERLTGIGRGIIGRA